MVFSDFGKSGSQVFGGRFNLVNVLPGLLLAIFVTALVRSGAYGGGQVDLRLALPASIFSPESFVFLLTMLLMGLLWRPFQVAVVQFLEGYWRTGKIRSLAEELHRRRMRTAEIKLSLPTAEAADTGGQLSDIVAQARIDARRNAIEQRADRRADLYPIRPEDVMPTSLGNILRAAETSAGERFGLSTVTMYPRLYPLLSDRLSKAMEQELDQLDATAGLCVTFLAATVFSIPLAYRLDLWSLIPAVTVALAILAYRGAIRTAQDHALLLASAFDLHRFDLLEAMHVPLPANTAEEFDRNTDISEAVDFPVFKERLPDFPYEHPGRLNAPSRQARLAGFVRRLVGR